jgi:hypothetical protein
LRAEAICRTAQPQATADLHGQARGTQHFGTLHRGIRWLLIVLLAASLAATAQAQDYRFRVEEMNLQVFVLSDASVQLDYKIVFQNQPGAKPIDVVDVGLPHANYDVANMSASIDGQPLTTIRPSEYIDIGVEVPLGGSPILPGEKGEFRFTCTMPDMVYQDTTDSNLASLQIRPTWFDPSLQVGDTHLRIAVHMLPGVAAENVKYQQEQLRYNQLVLFGEGQQKHAVAIWDWPGLPLSADSPKVGVSFPKDGLDRVVTMSAFGLLLKWFSESPEVQLASGAFLILLFLVTFFRFSRLTGWVLALLGAGGLGFVMWNSPTLHLLLWPVVVVLFVLNEWLLSRRGKRTYLSAMATVEGGGIKRGLTAPQAAALLELPLGKVLALVVFGLLKKGVLRVVEEQPLTVDVLEPYRVTRRQREKVAAKNGIVLHGYEHPFIDRLLVRRDPVSKTDLSAPLTGLIKETASRMRGFDLSDTQDYYRRIVARAWSEAEQIGEIEQRTETVERNVEWMMLDPDWSDRFGRWGGSYHYFPSWARTAVPSAAAGTGSTVSLTAPSGSSRTSVFEVGASFVAWAENTAGSLVGKIEPAKLGIAPPAGIVDLSGVDKVTAEVFEAMSKSSGSGGGGGGGGGGCACACAGCACACACAGGGR